MENTTEIKITAHPQLDANVCKFVVDRELYSGSYNCQSKDNTEGSALLKHIFAIQGVSQVLVADNTVTVAKASTESWQVIGKQVGVAIRAAINSGETLMAEDLKQQQQTSSDKPGLASPEAYKIQELLRMQINPAVAAHGGNVSLVDIKDDIVYVELSGGCQGCGMASATLKQGIEVAIKEAVPTVQAVYDVTDHASGTNPYYKP